MNEINGWRGDENVKISNVIEAFIKEMISEANGETQLNRNELATRFHCVPSQINYVISTRFSPERGYIVESRRGGGGYIRITQVQPKQGTQLMHVVNVVGDMLSYTDARAMVQNCFDYDLITEKEAKLIMAALSDKSLPVAQPQQDMLRAKIFKNILLCLA